MSKIQWTEKTWNPISGCSRKSTGCENCYAETMTKRLEAMGLEKYTGLLNAQGRFNGVVKLDEHALLEPLRRKKPTTYFVNSMSDLFHESIPDEWIDKIFAVMALCPQHTFQVLTKRADRMRAYFSDVQNIEIDDYREHAPFAPAVSRVMWSLLRIAGAQLLTALVQAGTLVEVEENVLWVDRWPLPNVWLGVSVENQQAADERIPHLLDTPAAIRFLSCEPLLGTIEFSNVTNRIDAVRRLGLSAFDGIDWVIVGGESGANARPCDVEWIRSIVEQCKAANVPVFVKQLGAFIGYREDYQGALVRIKTVNRKGGHPAEWPEDLRVREMPTI